VQVFDAGVSREGMAYLVMELLEGRSLAEELRAVGKLPLARAAAITVQICGALGAAHAKGILHRDIKPENVFLHRGPGGEVVKVVDFGIAKLMGLEDSVGDGRETRGVIGTVAYTSPERFKRDPYDARTDVYSVGVTVFEMLSGTLPYPPGERTLLEQLMRQLADPPADLGVVVPDVPPEVRRVVMACLNHNPGVRPTLAVLASVLEPFAGPMPALTVSSTSLPAPPRVDALGATMETPFPAKAPVLDSDDGATTQEMLRRPR
jgi:serine/threonine protein kinase